MTYRLLGAAALFVGVAGLQSCSVVNAPEEAQEVGGSGQGAQGAAQQGGGGSSGGGGSGAGGGSGGEAGSVGCGPITTLENCGACGVPCEPVNASGATCTTGSCDYASCDGGWLDCDGARDNGCETDSQSDPAHCNGCDQDCGDVGFQNVASLACVDGGCDWQGCSASWGDCDGQKDNGCEQPVDTVVDCGDCGVPCQPANVLNAMCPGGSCGFDSCGGDFQDCDGDTGNGCESDRLIDPLHCGNCATSCQGNEVCVNGNCTSCVPEQVTLDIPFAQTTGWGTVCCGGPDYRVGEGAGTTISGSFNDPLGLDGTVASVQVLLGVRHACDPSPAMEFRFNNALINVWGQEDGPHCSCGNPAVALSTNPAPPNSYARGGQNTVSVVQLSTGTCHEAIQTHTSLPPGTAFRVIVDKTCP